MKIIPVIDVRNGVAVRARGGNRDHYEPLVTPLVDSCDPGDVVQAFMTFFPFEAIYVADLDGIEGRGRDHDLIPELRAAVGRDVALWVDCGLSEISEAPDLLKEPANTIVLGSENLQSIDALSVSEDMTDRVVLSLDFQGDAFLGPQEVFERADRWPQQVIVMTLARVGGAGGPDLDRIVEIAERAGGRAIFAAGGIRNQSDLATAESAGADGALIASAFHNESIKADDLKEIVSL